MELEFMPITILMLATIIVIILITMKVVSDWQERRRMSRRDEMFEILCTRGMEAKLEGVLTALGVITDTQDATGEKKRLFSFSPLATGGQMQLGRLAFTKLVKRMWDEAPNEEAAFAQSIVDAVQGDEETILQIRRNCGDLADHLNVALREYNKAWEETTTTNRLNQLQAEFLPGASKKAAHTS